MKRDVQLFRALDYELRLSILTLLRSQDGTITVDKLLELLKEQGKTIGQPTLSHHLRILAKAGIIDHRKDGTYCYYYICPEMAAHTSHLVQYYIGIGGSRELV